MASFTLGLLISSLFHSTNLTVRVATVVFCTLALFRPGDALLAATAFAGFGDILGHVAGIPTLRAEEAMVVASLFGWCVRAISAPDAMRRAFDAVNAVPVVLLGLTVVCSAVVWTRVDQAQTTYASTYAADLWRWFSTKYFVDIGQFMDLTSTAVFLEGLALYLAIASMCRVDRAYGDRVGNMLIVGGAALGALSVFRLFQIALRNPDAIAMLQRSYAGLRISPQIPDYIAAAAYFALCWTSALGLVVTRQRGRVFVALAAIPLMAGLYLTGSRSAIAAAAAGLAMCAFLLARRHSFMTSRRTIGVAAFALVVLAIAFPKLVGHDLTGATAGESLKMRVELLKAGTGVLGTHPIFGVGMDRFFLYVDRFASPQLMAMWTGRKNPHNDFVRIATEFGLVGLVLFLWILIGCARRIRAGWKLGGDPGLAGFVGGLTAFAITMLISNPLMVHPVSYVFWIALGMTTGQATAAPSAGANAAEGTPTSTPRTSTMLLALAACLLVVSVPLRAVREVDAVNLAGVTYGLDDWARSADGVPSRRSGARATLFVPGDTRLLELPFRSTLPAGAIQTVQISVDGRLANELAVGADWQQLRLPLTPDQSKQSRRIDLRVSPTWIPGGPSSTHRPVGVEVGRPSVMRGSSGGH